MSKNYDDVKRAAEANIRGLCRAIKSNLNEEETEKLFIELSMSLFTASVDFSLPFEKFAAELAHKQVMYTMQIAEILVDLKHSIDAGEDYDAEEI